MSEVDTIANSIDSYVRLTLDSNPLNANRLADTFTRLREIRHGSPIETRIVLDDRLEYYVGTAERDLLAVEHAFRGLFPDGMELERSHPPEMPEEPTTALVIRGRGERLDDWQTRLRPVFYEGGDHTRLPLAAAVNTLASADATVHYQALLTPKERWRGEAGYRIEQLKRNRDTPAQRLFDFIFNEYEPYPSFEDAAASHQQRIRSIEDASPNQSYAIYARAIASGPAAIPVLDAFANALTTASGDFYHLDPIFIHDADRIQELTDQIRTNATPPEPSLARRLTRRLPGTSNADPEIVAGPLTAPNLCLFDGDSVAPETRRALTVTPDERTAITRPDDELLAQYDAGMCLGYPLTEDDTSAETPISLPPSMQPLHAAWFGKTGSGKSTALITAILENHEETRGADILIDPKGDGMPADLLRAHYHRHGTLDNVYYFDCAETLPAISFFDIRDQLEAGIDRTTAIEDVTDHYVEMLVGIMGKDRFERAVRSPDIIRYLVKALFDPVHGSSAFAHSDLQAAATRMRKTRDAPPVVDPELERMLAGVVSNSKRSFDELMQGVANRIEKIPLDDRLGQLFNHVVEPDAGRDGAKTGDAVNPRFDLRELLDEDALVIIDTGRLRPESQRAVTLVILSQLWTALQRRHSDRDDDGDVPLVNLYLEEAASIASSGLVTDLLAQSRSFGLSATLAMQFPAQLRQADTEAYAEILNNVSTIVTGNVAVDEDLKKRLATEAMDPNEVANRLRALRRGQWFVSLPSEFGRDEPRPFLLESAPIPDGHPESDRPLSGPRETAFEGAFDAARDRTRLDHGIDIAMTRQRRLANTALPPGAQVDDSGVRTSPSEHPDDAASVSEHPDSLLAHTKRLPDVVEYDADIHALRCDSCETRYDPTRDGIERAIECCHSLADVDRDDVPICSLNLKLSADERIQSPYTDAQLRFLHAVYAAHQQRFDPDLEYDLLTDSMIRLQEYVGVSTGEVDQLREAGLLAKDCQFPHVLYTVTPEGRKAAKITHREGVAHGDGVGDLSESSLHVAMVELGKQYLQAAFVENPESAAVEVSPYHDVEHGRLDVAALDESGAVVVTVEAERSNHDTRRAAPEDFDKMAATDPEAAIWIVETREGAHDVLEALNQPPEGPARVEKTYSPSSPPQRFTIDTPGLTEVHTFTYLRDSILG